MSSSTTITRINDMRLASDFRATSFSNFKMTDVRKQFLSAVHAGKIEPACYWCAEMICSGHLGDIWELLIQYMAKYIHLANPKLAIYLDMRFNVFRNIATSQLTDNQLDLRNNEKIRKLFAEVVCTLALSNKKPSLEPMKINRASEFDMTRLSERLKAPSMDFAKAVFKPKDPKELFIAVNEFSFHSSPQSRDMSRACYWIEWAMEFEQICKLRKEPCVCERRSQHPIEKKYSRDVIWLFWDVMLQHAAGGEQHPLVEKTMQSLLRLFCVKYTTAACKRRRHLLYYAVGLLTEPLVSLHVEMMPDRELLETVVHQIDHVYRQIKKNEVAPKTDYLFQNVGGSPHVSTERILQQLEMMNHVDQFGERGLERDTTRSSENISLEKIEV